MARPAWLLVEWIDENNMIPSYGIVTVNTLCYKQSDLEPGKKIFISLQLNEPRRAQIIRISDKKSHVQDHKEFLERQDQQVKNVLQMCIRTIKEMKSEQYSGNNEKVMQHSMTSQKNNLPHIITANSDNSASDHDSDTTELVHHSRTKKNNVKHVSQPQHKRMETNSFRSLQLHSPGLSQRRRSVISSTPLPNCRSQENVKLCYDQGTQTDSYLLQPPFSKIEQMETALKQLYGRFQSLLLSVNNNNGSIDISELEQNDYSYVEPERNHNESWVTTNIVFESVKVGNTLDGNNVDETNNAPIQSENHNIEAKTNVKMENERSINKENPMRIRRMSAQTTESEMLPIGDGNAAVPQRLFNDIDWNSYTTATRQLLQAVFSRKVLATHSLTGKQSPAHLNKPPKKILDTKLVDDIVKTVSSRCGVPKNLVRNSITVKCTDEAKLYRNRQRHRLNLTLGHQNEENIPPSVTPSSDESHVVESLSLH